MDRINTINTIRKVAVAGPATVQAVVLVLLATALFSTSSGVASAQDTNVPVAQPADQVSPPVAQPAAQIAPDANPTNAAPSGGLVVTTPAAARFDSAMVSFNAGQYAEAVTAFSDFVRDFPEDRRREEALYRLAESYRSLGRTDDALAAYTFQVRTYPDGPLRVNAELRRGAILYDAGKFGDAVPALRIVAEKGDGDLQEAAEYLLGRSLLATQKEAEGRAVLQGLVDESQPGKISGSAAQTLAELDDSEGNSSEAAVLWQKALALATDPAAKATAAARGGWSALEAKQPEVAEKLFQIARQLDAVGEPRKVANTGLLRLLFAQKRYAEWVALYGTDKGALLDSARSEVLYDLGQAQFSLKNWPAAVAAFDQYLSAFSTQDTAVTVAYERFLAITQLDRTRTVAEAEVYLKARPQSPYRARVQLLEAQELSRERKFAAALPLWESLAGETGDASWPHQDILLERARAYDEVGNFAKAATAYQAYLDDLEAHPGADKEAQARSVLRTQARLAVCLQKADQLLAATDAWKAVQSLAPDGSREQETALESLGLIYARGGPSQEAAMVATFKELLDRFPQSPLRARAAFSVGDSLFKNRDYAGAEPLLLNARSWDPRTWYQPATQRLALGAYGLKNVNQALTYMKEYDASGGRKAAELPAAFYYWLADDAGRHGNFVLAEALYPLVIQNPDPGDLAAGAWWQLGEAQSHREEWPAAVSSYDKYREIKPAARDATTVLLALGRAQLGAQNFDAAKALANQALLQEPEGSHSAAARMLLGETAFATQNYAEAARTFATLAVLFDDPKITPQAISRAADSFDKAGNASAAVEWRQKLKDKYPQYEPSPLP